MRDVHKIIDVSVTTSSTRPLREIEAVDSVMKFELTEAIALRMCTDLERFLTQEPHQEPTAALPTP
jgi:hypothetical protein